MAEFVTVACPPPRDSDPREYGYRAPDGTEWIHVPWSGWQRQPGRSPFLRKDDQHG